MAVPQPITHVVIFSEHPGQNPISGAERQIFLLLEELATATAGIELIALVWSLGDYPTLQQRFDKLASLGVRTTVIQRRHYPGLLRWIGILAAYRKLFGLLLSRRKGMVHIHLDLKIAIGCAALAGCRRTVVTVHNDERYYRTVPWRMWLMACRFFVSHFVGITDHVTNYMRDITRLPHDRVLTISYAIERTYGSVLGRSELGLPAGRFIVGFVGRLTEQKNLHEYLAAAAKLPELLFVLVGNGPERPVLEAAAAQRGQTNVVFTGAIQDAARLMTAFDLLCLPSVWEGLGLVLVEAMSQGVPVAGSRRGAIPEVLGDGRFGILFDLGADEIARALAQAAADRAALRQRAQAAQAHVEAHYTTEALVRSTLNLYQKVGC